MEPADIAMRGCGTGARAFCLLLLRKEASDVILQPVEAIVAETTARRFVAEALAVCRAYERGSGRLASLTGAAATVTFKGRIEGQ